MQNANSAKGEEQFIECFILPDELRKWENVIFSYCPIVGKSILINTGDWMLGVSLDYLNLFLKRGIVGIR